LTGNGRPCYLEPAEIVPSLRRGDAIPNQGHEEHVHCYPLDGFRPLRLEDREILGRYLKQHPPKTSELTMTNLFMWRHRHHPRWHERDGFLFVVLEPAGQDAFGLPPLGPGDGAAALDFVCRELEKSGARPTVRLADRDFVDRFVDPDRYQAVLEPNQSDYVYRTRDLIELAGRKYHRKKNFLNRFLKSHAFEFAPLTANLARDFLEMQERWCRMKNAGQHPELLDEDRAIREALTHFEDLDFKGGAIVMDGRVEAFSLGEVLNPETAVIHIEKANPGISGLYAAINQRFCQEFWAGLPFVNREQDLGRPGLRKAKRSYFPHHMVDKFTVTPREAFRG
jgi:hypothetical protein